MAVGRDAAIRAAALAFRPAPPQLPLPGMRGEAIDAIDDFKARDNSPDQQSPTPTEPDTRASFRRVRPGSIDAEADIIEMFAALSPAGDDLRR